MRNTLVIDISGQMLQVTRMVPVSTGHLLTRLGRALVGAPELQIADTVQLIGAIDASSVGSRLEQALDAIGKRGVRVSACDIKVQLGADFAKVAIIDDPHGENKGLDTAALDQHLQTWMAWNWGVTSQGIVRHAPLSNGRWMVSLVERDMLDALEAYCQGRKLRLVDCRPALLTALEASSKESPSSGFEVLVLEEVCEGSPSPLVQFIALYQGTALSIHRMWLPEASRESVQGVAQRVRAHHAHTNVLAIPSSGDVQDIARVRHLHWPPTGNGVLRG